MALTKILDASIEPVSLARVKQHLRITGTLTTDEEQELSDLITVARTTLEDRIQRTLISTTYRLVLDEFPDAIEVPMPPLDSVTSLQYVDTTGATQTMDPSTYSVDAENAPGWVLPAADLDWPETDDQINSVALIYIAGYGPTEVDVPAPLRHWILLAVGEMYENRERSAEKPAVPHDFADDLIRPYRFMVV